MLEMMSSAPTKAGKHVLSNVACVRYQWYTNDPVFWLAQLMLCIMTGRNFPPFVGPNDILNGLSIRQLGCRQREKEERITDHKYRVVVATVIKEWRSICSNAVAPHPHWQAGSRAQSTHALECSVTGSETKKSLSKLSFENICFNVGLHIRHN